MSNYCIKIQDVHKAAERIKGIAKKTPVLTNQNINELVTTKNNGIKRNVFFKVEALQQTGSFKFRGALNSVKSLMEEKNDKECNSNAIMNNNDSSSSKKVHVVTHSSGNHAAALAYAAKCCCEPTKSNNGNTKNASLPVQVEATIVMPKNAPQIKKENTLSNGGNIVFVENTNEARESKATEIMERTGAEFIHPSEDPRVIAGQGTVSLEMMEQVRELSNNMELDLVIMPVGGGGLTSGNTITLRALNKNIKIILAEPKEVDDAKRSFESKQLTKHKPDNKLNTIADGLKTTLGPNTWPIVRDLVDDVITVSEEDIVKGVKLIWEKLKVCIEPSAATGVAVLLGDEFSEKYLMKDDKIRNIGVILSGGNVDIFKITEMMKSV